jgi:hypothetical protein
MFLPEYTITPKILRSISNIEYAKAIVDTTKILPTWKKRLQKEALVEMVSETMKTLNLRPNVEVISRHIDGFPANESKDIRNIVVTATGTAVKESTGPLEEGLLKKVHKSLGTGVVPETKLGKYRNKKIQGKTEPEEILAQVVQLFDWYNSKDGRETHPVIKAGILQIYLSMISPFETLSNPIINFAALKSLVADDYDFDNYANLTCTHSADAAYGYYGDSFQDFDPDITEWLQDYCINFAATTKSIKDRVLLVAKEAKVAKAAGRSKLTARQERIVEYLQDYGMVQNKNFAQLFPTVSEDSILRDLKKLIAADIVVKRGSTKSSRYELR